MLVYVDDVLHLAKDAQEDMLGLNQVYLLRECFGPSDRYLGASANKFQLKNERTVCSITCI